MPLPIIAAVAARAIPMIAGRVAAGAAGRIGASAATESMSGAAGRMGARGMLNSIGTSGNNEPRRQNFTSGAAGATQGVDVFSQSFRAY